MSLIDPSAEHPPVRPAVRGDLVQIHAIEEASFSTDRLSLRSLRRHAESPTSVLRVIARGDVVLGYSLFFCWRNAWTARIYSLAVEAASRGRGLGDRLLADAEHQAQLRGYEAIKLEARLDNEAARRLYLARGYLLTQEFTNYYKDGTGALQFRKILAPTTAR